MLESIGWTGSMMLAICELPQVFKCWKEGHADGVSWGFLFLWGGGEVLLLIYSVFVLAELSLAKVMPLVFNYGLNVVLIGIIVYFKARMLSQAINGKHD